MRHREAVSISVCPHVLPPVEKLELGAARRAGRMSVLSSCPPRGPCPHPLGRAGLGVQRTRQSAVTLQALVTTWLSCRLSSREGRRWLLGSNTLLS